jgi:cell surface protein SprA
VEAVRTTSTTIRASRSEARNFSANSGVALFAGISVDVSYGRNTRETFDSNPTKNISESWPDLKFNLRSVKGLWYLGKVINTLSPSSHYSRSKDTKRRTTAAYPSTISIKEAFSPLISFTVNPMSSMRSTIRYETSSNENTKISETSGITTNITRNSNRNFSFSWSYSFRNPSGVRLPVFGRIKFESNLSVTLDVSYRLSKTESANESTAFDFKVTEDKTSLSIRPSANYSFSSTVKGGLSARWQDSNDLRTDRKTHTRELQIWVELRF